MSADRLAELQRQRAILQEHLAWLEREIAASRRAMGEIPATTPEPAAVRVFSPALPLAATVAAATPFPRPLESTAAASEADALLEEYRVKPDTLKKDVRQGCLLYFVAALVLLAGVVLGLYYALRSN